MTEHSASLPTTHFMRLCGMSERVTQVRINLRDVDVHGSRAQKSEVTMSMSDVVFTEWMTICRSNPRGTGARREHFRPLTCVENEDFPGG